MADNYELKCVGESDENENQYQKNEYNDGYVEYSRLVKKMIEEFEGAKTSDLATSKIGERAQITDKETIDQATKTFEEFISYPANQISKELPLFFDWVRNFTVEEAILNVMLLTIILFFLTFVVGIMLIILGSVAFFAGCHFLVFGLLYWPPIMIFTMSVVISFAVFNWIVNDNKDDFLV
ncbi:15617_t:CDS:1 [Entrophospora sp. SA101]